MKRRKIFHLPLAILAVTILLEATISSSDARRRNQEGARPAKCYAKGTNISEEPLEFNTSGDSWPSAEGDNGSFTTNITYSYSNLLDGGMQGLTANQLRRGVEEALRLWASVAPLHFTELEDSGPPPSDDFYSAAGHAQIRLGHENFGDGPFNALAHAYFPFSNNDGRAGDVHFDSAENWGANGGGFFVEVCLHELGHSLGLDHEDEEDAILNPTLQNRFNGFDDSFLLQDDIDGIRAIYGAGVGSVTPLGDPGDDDPGDDDPGDDDPGDDDPGDDDPGDDDPGDDDPGDDDPGDDDPGDDDPGDDDPGDDDGVTVSYDRRSNTLNVTGDNGDNNVAVYSAGWATVVLGQGGTEVNGGVGVMLFNRRPVNLNCEMNGGSDLLTLFQIRLNSVDCDLGDGNDQLVVLFSSMRGLICDGGAGFDIFGRLGSFIRNPTIAGFELEL